MMMSNAEDERLKELIKMLEEELKNVAECSQEEMLAELLEKLGLVDYDPETGMLRLTERGKKLITMSD